MINKIRANEPIVNGGAVVCNGIDTSSYNTTPNVHTIPNVDSAATILNMDARFRAGEDWGLETLPSSADDISSVSGLSPCGVYYGPGSGTRHVLYSLEYSFSGPPSGAHLTVQSPSGTAIFGPHYITSAGPNQLEWAEGLKGQQNESLFVNLAGSVSGLLTNLSITGRKVE